MLMKAKLNVRPRDRNTLQMRLDDAQFARINRQLDQGWDSEISSSELSYQPMKISNKPFEVQLKNGAMRSISFPAKTNNDEANMIKGIVSQLQIDTQAQNLIKCQHNQMPEKSNVNGVYKTMEPTVTGKCETVYDISPIPEHHVARNPEWVPLPKLKREKDQYIEVVKSTNYSNCDDNLGFHYGITQMSNQKPGSNKMGEWLARSNVQRAVLTGTLQNYTIQSSVTVNQVAVSPELFNTQKGMVVSRVNLTLFSVQQNSAAKNLTDMVQTSLYYQYNNVTANGKLSTRRLTSIFDSSLNLYRQPNPGVLFIQLQLVFLKL